MKLVVVGASGATGRRVVQRALALGHHVVAVSRRPPTEPPSCDRLTVRTGDVLDPASLAPAFAGADAAISCIGPDSNLSPGHLMSVGIPNILAACRQIGVPRFVMQSGITLTDGAELSAPDRWALRAIRLVFRKALADKRPAERAVRESGLDWVIVRPAGLRDLPAGGAYRAGPGARVALLRPLAFGDCADCLVRAATVETGWTGQVVNVGH